VAWKIQRGSDQLVVDLKDAEDKELIKMDIISNAAGITFDGSNPGSFMNNFDTADARSNRSGKDENPTSCFVAFLPWLLPLFS
jgi:hypothetical protein